MPPRRLAVAGLLLSFALLLPGILLPVITVRGTLDPAGVSALVPKLLDQGLSDAAVAQIRPLLNPAMLPMLDASPGGLKSALVSQLGGQLSSKLSSSPPVEVYTQTRSILGSVRHLYQVGSGLAASLILLFSVIVPVGKGVAVLWALFHPDAETRRRTTRFVETIAKWSMADVFAVALFIAWLAAKASQSMPGSGVSAVSFSAVFGPGWYWFTAYCIVSLGTQQMTARWLRAAEG